MKHATIGFTLVLLMIAPLAAFGQTEDTLFVPDLFGTGQFLNQIMAQDTAGTGWQGAAGVTAWQNKTRVYVLAKNGLYPVNGSFDLQANRKLVIKAQPGNYSPGHDFKPEVYGIPSGTGAYPGRIFRISGPNGEINLKNITILNMDESLPGGLDKVGANMVEIQSTGTGSVFVDSCILKSANGQLMQIGAGGSIHAGTIKVTNTLFADMGFLGMTNLGAGRGIDLRNSEIDSVIIENCTFVNWQDRIVRHYLSNQPIHSFRFNHNTVMNGISYHGLIALGRYDSSATGGPFEIRNNLFVDAFAMGPDTDAVRQAEFNDNEELDPVNNLPMMTWIIARKNTTAHNTPWLIRNNYYAISDSGQALRDLTSPYLRTPVSTLYPGREEPILNADLKRLVNAAGGNAATAFQKVTVQPTNIPPVMSKMIRWYYSPLSAGSPANSQDNVGAGAGRKKDGSSGTPATNFVHDVTNNVWVYDFNRRTSTWYQTDFDAGYKASIDLSAAGDDGKIVGSTMWSFKGVVTGVADAGVVPDAYTLNQNYPNPFNPATKISFALPTSSTVRLEVFDMLGRSVAVVASGSYTAGRHEVSFDAAHLQSGMYVYRLTAGSATIARKMMLVK